MTLSPEAQKAKDEAAIRCRERQELAEKMRQGPYYAEGLLRIPSYFFDSTITPIAKAEWQRRGLRWNPSQREWCIAIPASFADDQVRRARQLFDFFWDIDQGHPSPGSGQALGDRADDRGYHPTEVAASAVGGEAQPC